MHYYQFNIGDYAKHTRHLTLMEDLVYRRLLDFYYDSEKPLTVDVKKLARLIGMGDYQQEVSQVLEDFFFLSDDGFIQKRVADEINKYTAKAETARVNGKLGGRPKKPKKTPPVNLANPDITEPKANQEPRTINQEPSTIKQPDKPTPFRADVFLLAHCTNKQLIKDWLKVRKTKRASNTETALNAFIKQVSKSGLNCEQVLALCCENSWAGFKASWEVNKNGQTNGSQQSVDGRTGKKSILDIQQGEVDYAEGF